MTIPELLEKYKDRSAEELRAFLEGYICAYSEQEERKRIRHKDVLDRLRKINFRTASVPSAESNATDSHPKQFLK